MSNPFPCELIAIGRMLKVLLLRFSASFHFSGIRSVTTKNVRDKCLYICNTWGSTVSPVRNKPVKHIAELPSSIEKERGDELVTFSDTNGWTCDELSVAELVTFGVKVSGAELVFDVLDSRVMTVNDTTV